MKTAPDSWTIADLLRYAESGFLTLNPDYQRGEAWDLPQKQLFADSVLRSYPVPAFFFHEIVTDLPRDQKSTRYEIVDGQQRLSALTGYHDNDFALLATDDKKFRVPPRVRDVSSRWAGRYFRDLPADLQEHFAKTTIPIYVVSEAMEDEVRDLFIRLQSGTALTRQQVRDAWPGPIGPFVERLAGKKKKRPSVALFRTIDRRSMRSDDLDEQQDPYVADRQSCAQLLAVFLTREPDPNSTPSIGARDLDGLYHERTDFDPDGPQAQRFEEVIRLATRVFERAGNVRVGSRKEKFRRIEVLAVVMYLQDVTKSDRFHFGDTAIYELGQRLAQPREALKVDGKGTSGRAILDFYQRWRDTMAGGLGYYEDDRRLFSIAQKEEIFIRDGGRCAICSLDVAPSDAEYDHWPLQHHDGGPTQIENGRLVHRDCHPRPGRPTS